MRIMSNRPDNSPSAIDKTINDCSLGGICGGCFYCGKNAGEQLSEKNNRVKNLLDKAVDYPYEYQGIIEIPQIFGYRNKMEYSFGDCQKDGPLTLGLHRKKSFYDVIDADSCLLVHNDCNEIVKTAADYFRSIGVTYKDKRSHKGYLRYLIIRRASHTGEILIDLVTTSQRPIKVNKHSDIYNENLFLENGSFNPLFGAEYLEEDKLISGFSEGILSLEKNNKIKGRIRGILHTVNDSKSDAVKDEGTSVLYGSGFITEKLMGLEFNITPFSFFQTNSYGAEVLYTKAREFIIDGLNKDMTAFDLYSGTGTIAQILAPCVKNVVGVEIIEEAVSAARENAENNGLTNCTFIAGDVLKVLDDLEAPDIIVLDPPRDGVNPKAIKKIISYGVNNILYISCKPESLARDMVILNDAGYKLIKAAAVDQFPWTNNVETVALLSRKKNLTAQSMDYIEAYREMWGEDSYSVDFS